MTARSSSLLKSLAIIAIATVPLTSCKDHSGAALCQAICECQDCSVEALDACIEDFDELETVVDDAGCAEAYDAHLTCLETKLECDQGFAIAEGCEVEEVALDTCLGLLPDGGGGSGAGTPGGGGSGAGTPGGGGSGAGTPGGGGSGATTGPGEPDPGAGGNSTTASTSSGPPPP